MICIHNSKHQSNALHTIIKKKEENGWVYIVAIGYGGGGVFEEFCGKFKFCNQEEQYIGTFSRFHDPDEWECEVNEEEIIDKPWSEIDKSDKLIIHNMSKTIWDDFIYYDEDEEIRLINDNILEKLSDDGVYLSDDWDVEFVDWVSNTFWGLSLTFDW